MKKVLLLCCLFYSMSLFAQNTVQLNIHHKLGQSDFEMNMGSKNNIGDDFNVSRLQYYISEITITHDSGMKTAIDDTWLLIDATESTSVDLGAYDITQVEGVSFYIGVNEEVNHDDPASYANDHPLAPKFPSMHWGWAAGYRFVAYEGKGGSDFNHLFQFHGLEDANYFQSQIDVTALAENGLVSMDIYADYTRALENITVSSGNIVHGGFGDAQKCLENFRDFVFSPTPPISTSTIDISEINHFDVFPNPSIDNTSIVLSTTDELNYQVQVVDILGRPIQQFKSVDSNATLGLNLKYAGIYFVNLIKDGQTVISKKLIKQ